MALQPRLTEATKAPSVVASGTKKILLFIFIGEVTPMGIWEAPIMFSQLRVEARDSSKLNDPIPSSLIFRSFSKAVLLSETLLNPRKSIG
jgi:hypothetical protein